MRNLSEIFRSYGCDKGSKHKYDLIYDRYMSEKRFDPVNILEIGIFKGNSIESWLEYFPNATVYGLDIFVRLKPEEIPVLKNPRVKWMKCDSTQEDESKNIWKDIKFDYIIDDGLHTPRANRLTFTNLIDKLSEDGIFFIEDVFPLDIMNSKEMQIPWLKKNTKEYSREEFDIFLNSINDFNYERHDNRAITKQPDSYIITCKKK